MTVGNPYVMACMGIVKLVTDVDHALSTYGTPTSVELADFEVSHIRFNYPMCNLENGDMDLK